MVSPREPKFSELKTLTGALEHCFGRFGDSVAVDAPGFKLTYRQLDQVSRHVASEIRTRCTDQQLKSAPIAILMSRSVEFYVAQVAILRAGGFLLPLDPLQPAERIEFLLSDSSSSLLLVREADSFAVNESAIVPFSINVERWAKEHHAREDQASTAATNSCGEVDENDFAYMIYTCLLYTSPSPRD